MATMARLHSKTHPLHPISDFQTGDCCGGHFPGPGIQQEDHVHCCDKCAAGPHLMRPRMVFMASLWVTSGVLLGRLTARKLAFDRGEPDSVDKGI